jgi:hypothetical protein
MKEMDHLVVVVIIEHQVQISAAMFANFGVTGSNGQTRVDGYNYTLTEEEWDISLLHKAFTAPALMMK